jgi:hypothetical protein
VPMLWRWPDIEAAAETRTVLRAPQTREDTCS